MKVLFDHQIYVLQQYGGISRYFYEISKGLQQDFDVEVINAIRFSNNLYTQTPFYNSKTFIPNIPFKGKGIILKNIGEFYSKRALSNTFDVFHPTYDDTYFFNSMKNKPFVITMHDLIHEKFSRRYDDLKSDKSLFQKRSFLLEKATKIISVSNNTKNDIIDTYKIPSTKIEVIHLASALVANDNQSAFPYRNYILYVGLRQSYKNFKSFLEAISPLLLKEKDLRVVCAGGGDFGSEELTYFKELKVEHQLIHVSVNDQLLGLLYKNAILLAFPSLYEGFGIPVLEAFGCSCPVAASNAGSIPEVGGNAALYFNPDDKDDMLDKVSQLIYNQGLREQLIESGLKRGNEFSWEKTTKKHFNTYQSLCL